MSLSRHIICTYLFVILASVQTISDTERKELKDEYYDIIPAETKEFNDTDVKDAKKIWENINDDAIIASILLYRPKEECFAINEQILKLMPDSAHDRIRQKNWITNWYEPQFKCEEHRPFMDLCFALIKDDNVVLGRYLRHFFTHEMRPWIVIGMVLVRDMVQMIQVYETDILYPHAFKDDRKKQKKPFENMLRVWARFSRDPIEEKLDMDAIKNDAELLLEEHRKDCWKEYRDKIEAITMQKSITYAREVIKYCEKSWNSNIEEVINACRDSHGLDWDLANTYVSLANFIIDRHTYIARLLYENCDEKEWLPAWMMCVTVVHPKEWPKVNQAFQKLYKSEATSLSDFIVKKVTQYKVLAEALAVVVDSNFTPTLFKPRPPEGGPEKPIPPRPT